MISIYECMYGIFYLVYLVARNAPHYKFPPINDLAEIKWLINLQSSCIQVAEPRFDMSYKLLSLLELKFIIK